MRSHRLLTLLSALLACAAIAAPAGALAQSVPLDDPIPEDPVLSGLGLTAQAVRAVPGAPSRSRRPSTRGWSARPGSTTSARCRTARDACTCPTSTASSTSSRTGRRTSYLDVGARRSPALLLRQRPRPGLRLRRLPPGVRAQRHVLHRPHRAGAALAHAARPTSPPAAEHRSTTASSPSGRRTTRRRHLHGTHREVLRLGFGGADPRHPADRLQPDGQAPRRATTACSTSRPATAASASRDRHPQNLAMPQGKILRIDPRGTNGANGRYGIPATQPVRRHSRARSARSTRTACATRTASAGTRRAATGCSSATSASTRSRRSYEVRAGDNFGWSEREGPFVFDKDGEPAATGSTRCPPDDAQFGYTYPVAAYDHDPPPGLELHVRRRARGRSAASSTAAATCPSCAASTSSPTSSPAASSTPNANEMRRGGARGPDPPADALRRDAASA